MIIMVEFRCADLGNECDWKVAGKDLDVLLGPIAAHASFHHGIDEISDELLEKVKQVLHDK
jgi:predicted small metal-binding protein